MIKLQGEKYIQRNYERLAQQVVDLEERSTEFNHYIKLMAEKTHGMWVTLKNDLDSKIIDEQMYKEFLKPLKIYFANCPPPYHSKLHADEILAEIKKYCQD